MSDEEKKAIKKIRSFNQYNWEMNNLKGKEFAKPYFDALDTVLNLIKKKSKEIEDLKEDRKKYAEEYIHNNPWLYKQLNENYILREESEQKEKKAYIDGTNVAHELCNKMWKNKIKAKIESVDYSSHSKAERIAMKEVLQSLLEKE